MMTIGSYFAFIIFVMGTMLAAHDISEEGEFFCNDQQNENNETRNKSLLLFYGEINVFGWSSLLLLLIFKYR